MEAENPKKSRRKWIVLAVLLGSPVLLLVALLLVQIEWPGLAGDGLPFTISHATTRIVEPLRPDGSVDYAEALRRQLSRGVTPENNAVVLLFRAFGPSKIKPEHREAFFRELGMEPLPEEGEYFRDLSEYFDEEPAEEVGSEEIFGIVEDPLTRAQSRPWSREEFPGIAQWLNDNEKPLALVVEASRRERFWLPLARDPDGLLAGVPLMYMSILRDATQALCARAMLRAGEADFALAQADLLACHRLGRLAAQGEWLIDALLGRGVDSIALQGDVALVLQGKLKPQLLEHWRSRIDDLPAWPSMIEAVDVGERYMCLDGVTAIAARRTVDSDFGLSSLRSILGVRFSVDWDETLRQLNNWYDRMAEAARKPSIKLRRAAVDSIEADLRKAAADASTASAVAAAFLSKKARSERLAVEVTGFVLASLGLGLLRNDTQQVREDLAQVAFALAAYRSDHGEYPEALSALKGRGFAEVARDRFSGADFKYRREGKGYVLWSVGPNGKDDSRPEPEDSEEGVDPIQSAPREGLIDCADESIGGDDLMVIAPDR